MDRGISLVLHHVEICVHTESSLLKKLIDGFGFKRSYHRSTKRGFQWVLMCGKTVLVITKRLEPALTNDPNETEHITEVNPPHDSYPLFFCRCGGGEHSIDSVFNVCLEVRDLDQSISRIKSKGGKIIQEPYTIKDKHGTLRMSLVASKCDNVFHSLIDKSDYNGQFLPGFKEFENPLPNEITGNHEEILQMTQYMDHITYVCRPGESAEIIQWYEECFGLKRFLSNRQDTDEDGFILAEGIGLRLKAMQYWRCAETGLSSPGKPDDPYVIRIVIAEHLPEIENSHVENFLIEHSGPGIQHIGLYSNNIVHDVSIMKLRGVTFRDPPPTYYEECGKLDEILKLGLAKNLDEFRNTGILLDSEENANFTEGSNRYLLQVFTPPIFEKDTFFLEVIQRMGAIGFGAGNITALSRSIIAYQEQRHRKQM